MRVFIGWSGDISHEIAKILHRELPKLNPLLQTDISDEIALGDIWFPSLRQKLQESDMAIFCITHENLDSPWLFFEAGAMMIKGHSRIIPLCVGVKASELKGPLRYFQSIELSTNAADIYRDWNNLNKLNAALEMSLLKMILGAEA